MKIVKRRALRAAAMAGVLALVPSAALAYTHSATSKDGGSFAYTWGPIMYVKDAKCDGLWSYGNYTRDGIGSQLRLNNKSGCNTTVNTANDSAHPVTALQACTQYDLSPDDCSLWR